MDDLDQDDLFTISEAGYVTRLDERAINREIDATVIEPKRGIDTARLLSKSDLLYLAAIGDLRTMLSKTVRLKVRKDIEEAVRRGLERINLGLFSLDLNALSEDLAPRFVEIKACRAIVECRKDVSGGRPVVVGTRIEVHRLANLMREGCPLADISAELGVDERTVRLAKLYASLHPRRGRPDTDRGDVRLHVPID